MDTVKIDAALWKKKAMAFVTRSHRHLWGKNNEDPLACLFIRGLGNDFSKNLYLGWNKFGQKRTLKNWGLEPKPGQPEKFLLPSGIVFPYIVDKNLTSIFIHSLDENDSNRMTMVPGSSSATIVLGNIKKIIVIMADMFDGLFLYQQAGKSCSVFIHPDPAAPFDLNRQSMLDQACRIQVFIKKICDNKTKKNQEYAMGKIFGLKKTRIEFYESEKDLPGLVQSSG